MRDYLIKRPMLLCAVISSVVCIIGYYSKNALFIIMAAVISLIFFMLYKKYNKSVIFSLILVLSVGLSMFWEISEIETINYYDGNKCKGIFLVCEEPELMGEYYTTVLETRKSDILKKGMKLRAFYYEGDFHIGEVISADITIQKFSYKTTEKSYYGEKIYLDANLQNIANTNENDFVLEAIGKLRNYIKSKIFNNYDSKEAATMLALVTGDRSYLSDSFYSNLKAAGVMHIMVVSGMHLSVIVGFLLGVIQRLFYNKYLKALTILIAVLTVLTVCGFTMSVLRAGITYILIAISLIISKPNTASNSLGAAVSLILLNSPFAIFNLAFELSVLSTFGILAVAMPVTNYIKENELIKNKFIFKIFSSVLISVSASVLTAPVTIYYFGYISNVSLITNLLVCYPSTIALILGVLGLILPVFYEPFFFLSELIIKYINGVVNYFGELPFAVTEVPQYFAVLALALIIAVLFSLIACKKRIDMLKLKEVNEKRIKEGGKSRKWRFLVNKR